MRDKLPEQDFRSETRRDPPRAASHCQRKCCAASVEEGAAHSQLNSPVCGVRSLTRNFREQPRW